jgi:hypothetical protein
MNCSSGCHFQLCSSQGGQHITHGSPAGWDIVGMVYSPNCGWSVANRYTYFICLVPPDMTMQEALDAIGQQQLDRIRRRILKEMASACE